MTVRPGATCTRSRRAVSDLRMPDRLLELGYPALTPDELHGVLGGNALALFGDS